MHEQINKWLNAIAAVCHTLDGGVQVHGVENMDRIVGSFRVLSNVASEMGEALTNSKENVPDAKE